MIEKLSKYKITSRDGNYINADNNTRIINTIVVKINELVDAVNELQKHEEQHLDLLTELNEMRLHQNKEPVENVQDKFAEQRKWIGKLCRFWDEEDEDYVYEILIDIEDDGSDYPYKMTDTDSENWTMSYKHCEPVSEDLIYKGE